MALWGNDDNLVSSGTVSLNYDTKVVTGSGTTFGTVGFGTVGDVIRFGVRGSGGTYYGDAVIAKVTSATNITIASTDGLTGAAIASKQYYLSELPISTSGNHVWSGKHRGTATFKNHESLAALADSGSGEYAVSVGAFNSGVRIATGDQYMDSPGADTGTGIEIIGVGTANATTTSASLVGYSTIYAVAPPGVVVGDDVTVTVGGVSGLQQLVSVASTQVAIAGTVSAQVNSGARIMFTSNNVISLKSTISNAISEGDQLYFQRKSGGYDKLVYGISDAQSQTFDGSSTEYRTEGAGWVGVTTYIDQHGNLRVKSETLVAMSGIQTGTHGITYPTAI